MNPGGSSASLPLADIHLPEAVSWWPIAPGWWILAMLFVLIAVFTHWWVKRRRLKKQSLPVLAQLEIQRIRRQFAEHRDSILLASELSELLRRISISVFPRQKVASLTGDKWLQFLDEQTAEHHFTSGEGRILIEAPYRPIVDYDHEILIKHVEQWLASVMNSNRGKQA